MKIKRALNGRFSKRRHYKLPESRIKPVLMWYYAGLGVLTSCVLIGGAFYESYNFLKQKYNEYAESKRIVVINEVGARVDDRVADVSGGAESIESEIGGDTEGAGVLERESPEETIKRVAESLQFEQVDNLLRLAKCESGFNPDAVNPTNNSYDRGVFQWSRRYHPEIPDSCAFDVTCATEKTIELIRKTDNYPHAWACKGVW